MTTHHFQPDHYHTTIGAHDPVLRIADGDTVVTTTVDAMGKDASDMSVTPRGNPMTGPFYIEGAEPGDTLALQLDRIAPNRTIGYTGSVVAPNVVDPWDVRELPDRALAEWRIDRAHGGTATLVKPETKLGNLTLPLAPMLGCFGVAPPRGQAISTATSGEYGGNMDYRGFVAGVTVYFPVFVPGALIHVGDGHAARTPTISSRLATPARSTRRCSTLPPRCCAGWRRTTGSIRSAPASCWVRRSSTIWATSTTRPTPWSASCASRCYRTVLNVKAQSF